MRENRTNPHRSRVEKLLASKKKSLDSERGDYKKEARVAPKDFQKVQYLLGKLNEKQMSQFEDEEEENDNFTREDELPFLESIINKKQKAKYSLWLEKGVVKN